MQHNNAALFRRLHQGPDVLRLPNAWDAASARVFENAGAPAIATTSAGVSWALGYRDGRDLPATELLAAAARIVRVLDVPLSLDIENGYSDQPRSVADFAVELARLGVAGINIEDGADDPSLLAAKIAAIREALRAAGADLFVNARCDVFLAALAPTDQQVQVTIQRGRQYAAAGADGLFVPGIQDEAHIREVVRSVSLPLNVMARPALANGAALAGWGVRRLSAGSAIAQLVLGIAERAAKGFLASGESDPLMEGALRYPDVQRLFR